MKSESLIVSANADVEVRIAGFDDPDRIPVKVQLVIVSDGMKEFIPCDTIGVVDSKREHLTRVRESNEHSSSIREEP